MNVQIRYGTISNIDAEKSRVRVKFAEDGDVVTPWLAVLHPGTKENKYWHIFDIDDHVACLMDSEGNSGVVLGSIYSKADAPDGTVSGEDIAGVKFSDGSAVYFDRSSKTLFVDSKSAVDVKAANTVKSSVGSAEVEITPSGISVKKGTESLKAICNDLASEAQSLATNCAAITVICAAPLSPSSPPVNAAAIAANAGNIAAIIARIPQLLT